MRLLTLLLALVLFFSPISWAQEQPPFLAIYCSADRVERFTKDRFNHHVDLFCKAKDWTSFEPFLKEVAIKAAGRPVILSMSVHGIEEVPLLCVGKDENHPFYATEGGMINKVEESGANILCIVEETCHASTVYAGSLNPPPHLLKHDNKRSLVENRKKGAPSFPVFGVEDFSSPIPSALEQYLHNDFQTISDLRKYVPGVAPSRFSKFTQEVYKQLNYMLLMKYKHLDGIEKL